VPILFGGHSDLALDRAGRLGDGWIAAPMSPQRLAPMWAKVVQAAERAGRDPEALCLVAASANVDLGALDALVDEYRDAGVDHLQLRVTSTGAEAAEQIERLGALRRRE
jgi:alkanesulfonate monooxygenase SsuD/methylene tetrahydromethanopterin reductase-like flavin-dependent oxidoreductase (luciferase family)